MKELKDMTAKELEEYKAKLYKENTDNGNIHKLCTIARMLGDNINANYGPKYALQDGAIQIYVDDYGHYMTVHEESKMKVSTHNEKLYAPGEWEQIITRLYPSAEHKLNLQNEARETARKNDILTKLS